MHFENSHLCDFYVDLRCYKLHFWKLTFCDKDGKRSDFFIFIQRKGILHGPPPPFFPHPANLIHAFGSSQIIIQNMNKDVKKYYDHSGCYRSLERSFQTFHLWVSNVFSIFVNLYSKKCNIFRNICRFAKG